MISQLVTVTLLKAIYDSLNSLVYNSPKAYKFSEYMLGIKATRNFN